MSTFSNFVTVLAWFFGCWSLLLIVMRIYARTIYTDLEKSIDRALKGGEYEFPLVTPTVITIICWSWVLAPYME